MKKGYKRCPYCLADVSEKNYETHINTVHAKEIEMRNIENKEKEFKKKLDILLNERIEERSAREHVKIEQIINEELDFFNKILDTYSLYWEDKKTEKSMLDDISNIAFQMSIARKPTTIEEFEKIHERNVNYIMKILKMLADLWDDTEHKTPAAGTLGRFRRKHLNEMITQELNLDEVKLQQFKEKLNSLSKETREEIIAEKKMIDEIEAKGRFKEILLELEGKKENMTEEERLETEGIQIAILNTWKPGYEEYINQLFFDERCKECKYKENGCDEGLADCIYEDEFQEFMSGYLKKTINDLKAGKEPEVPKELQERMTAIKKQFEQISHLLF